MTLLTQKNACDLLQADHIAVKHLFVDYARLAVLQRPRRAIALRICNELTVHARIEEEVFYPALSAAVGQPELVDAAKGDHQQARALIARIEGLRAEGGAMDELVAQLAQVVEQHVKEERDSLFAKARANRKLDLDDLAGRLRSRQVELEAPSPQARRTRSSA